MKLLSKIPPVFTLGIFFSFLYAQEVATKWDVEILTPMNDGKVAAPIAKPEPIDLKILSSRTTRMDVTQAPEMQDLSPVTGKINVTVQLVEAPNLPDLPPPLPALPPDNPAVQAWLAELGRLHRATELVFLSATVYDHKHTLLRIYPNGKVDQMICAWSNLDFNHFSGFSIFRVKDGVDGSHFDYGLLMGIGNFDSKRTTNNKSAMDKEHTVLEIPPMPDLATSGPSFVVIEGDQKSPAMLTLEQLHDLYKKEGKEMENAYYAREKARADRKAYLLANPPKPEDVTIQFWKRDTPSISDEQSIKEGGQR